jgi:hypothetical protein
MGAMNLPCIAAAGLLRQPRTVATAGRMIAGSVLLMRVTIGVAACRSQRIPGTAQ